MKNIKDFMINEGNHRFYPEDWNECETEEDVSDAIIEALSFSGIYDSFCESIENGLDHHIFMDDKFLKIFGKALSEEISNWWEENYD